MKFNLYFFIFYYYSGLAINEYENTPFRPDPLETLDFELTFS
jgi:hypothetical protein